MTASQLLNEAEKERILLITKINELNLTRSLEEDLIIFDTPDHSDEENIQISDDYKMFKEVRSLSIWSRKRGKRYTKQQALQLEELLERYPTKHQNIRRLLKIPSSSFQMLKSEANREHNTQLVPKCRRDQAPKLHDSEKKFIENMIRPPTFPTTILEI